jgi:hypothetical protein
LRFILLSIPIPKISKSKGCYVKRLVEFARTLIPIEMVLLDRGFYSWDVIKTLQEFKMNYIILVPKYDNFKRLLKEGSGIYEHCGRLNRDKTTYKISTYTAIIRDYLGHDWIFATNIKYEKIIRYVHYYKKRWGIETTFRVQDEVRIKTKSVKIEIRVLLFLFECLLYNIWQFFKGRIPFRRFIRVFCMTFLVRLIKEGDIEIDGLRSLIDV